MKPVLPLLWRIEATSPEKTKIVLGKFNSEEEAQAERTKLESVGFYKHIKVVAIPPPPPGYEPPVRGYRRPAPPAAPAANTGTPQSGAAKSEG